MDSLLVSRVICYGNFSVKFALKFILTYKNRVFFSILVYFSILILRMGRKKFIYQNGQILPSK